MDRSQIKQYIIDNNYPNAHALKKKEHQEFVYFLREATSGITMTTKDFTNGARCFFVINNIFSDKDIPSCKGMNCKQKVTLKRTPKSEGNKYNFAFREYCSKSCMENDEITKEKRMKSTEKKFENLPQNYRKAQSRGPKIGALCLAPSLG